MDARLNWSPLRPFGARIELDCMAPIGDRHIELLRSLYDAHHLLLFPNQKLSSEQQVRVSSWFGPIALDKGATHYSTTDPALAEMGAAEITFHSDLSCATEPLLGISLHAIDVAEEASPTLFIDAMAAAADLPDSLRNRLEGLHVMNLWPLKLAERQRRESSPEDWPGAVHPLLKQHPRTGAAILYLNASHTDRIIELSADESENLIQELFGHLYSGAHCYVHRWMNGDLIVWDNLALQHRRPESPRGVPRTLQRVEIGSNSYAQQMPPEVLEAYGVA